MTVSPLDYSSSHIPRQIQENLIAYMRIFSGQPGIEVVDDTETFWIVSNRPAPGNMILRVHWPKDGVEERIDGLFAQISSHIDQIDWMVFPVDQPSDICIRLEERGMPGGSGGNWLWADLSFPIRVADYPQRFRVEQVCDDQKMADWVRVSEEGFDTELGCFYDANVRHGYGQEASSRHYIGYSGDIPVTSGTLLEAGGCASIYDISTPRAYRSQGFGGSLTHTLMSEIQNRGYKETWIWASNQAKSVYQKLGYVEANFGIREHTWQKRPNRASDNSI